MPIAAAGRQFGTILVGIHRLQRESHPAASPQCRVGRRKHLHQVAEVDQCIGGQHHVPGFRVILQVRAQLGGHELVVAAAQTGLFEHPAGQVHAIQPTRMRPDQRTAQAGAATGVEHIKRALGHPKHANQCVDQDLRRTIVQVLQQLLVEAFGEPVEHLAYISVVRPRWRRYPAASGEHVPWHGVVRLAAEPVTIGPDRLVLPAQHVKGDTERVESTHIAAVAADRVPETGDGVLQVPDFVHMPAQVHAHQVMGEAESWRPLKQLGMGLEGLLEALLRLQHQRQVAQRIVVLPIACQCLAIAGLGLGELAGFFVDVAEIVVRVGMQRGGPQGHPDQPDAFVAAPALMAQHAEKMQCIGLPGLHLQRPAVERLRCIQLPDPMHLDRLTQHGDHAMIDIRRMALAPRPAGRRPPHPGIRRSFVIGLPTALIDILLAAGIGVARSRSPAMPPACTPPLS